MSWLSHQGVDDAVDVKASDDRDRRAGMDEKTAIRQLDLGHEAHHGGDEAENNECQNESTSATHVEAETKKATYELYMR